MANAGSISGANVISGSYIASGSIIVNEPFAIGVSGDLEIYAKTNEGIKIHIPSSDVVIFGSDGKVRWVEKRK